jgi:reactive intermediate/imine deaminase
MLNRLLFASLALVVGSATATADHHKPMPTYYGPPGNDGSAPYSPVVVAGDTIYLSGHLGIVPGTMKLAEGGIQAETKQTLENLQASLERAGGSMDKVVKCTVFLADIAEWAAMNEVYVTFFPNKPARSAVGNITLGLNARVEIECIAVK